MDSKETYLFFQFVPHRYEKNSAIITSNKSFGDWQELLGDAVVATANPDRLLHRCKVEAEWEYACRAESTGTFNTGKYLSISYANYNGNPGRIIPEGSQTLPVKKIHPMHRAYVTCTVMSGSGVRTGMEIIHRAVLLILPARHLARTACFAAAVGAPPPRAAGRPLATGMFRTSGLTPWVSAWLWTQPT